MTDEAATDMAKRLLGLPLTSCLPCQRTGGLAGRQCPACGGSGIDLARLGACISLAVNDVSTGLAKMSAAIGVSAAEASRAFAAFGQVLTRQPALAALAEPVD